MPTENPVRILFTADVHIGRVAGFGEKTAAHQRAIREAFERVAACAAENADLLVVAGDLVDREFVWGAYIEQAVAVLQQALDKAPGLKVVLIAGNHDPALVYQRWEWGALGERAIIVTRPQLLGPDELGVNVYLVALPWQEGTALQWDDWPSGPTVVAAHACWPPPPDRRGADNCVLERQAIERWPASFVGVGHYHRPSLDRVGNVPVAMIGPPEIIDIDQQAPGQGLLVSVKGSGEAELSQVGTGKLRGLGVEQVAWDGLPEPRNEALKKRLLEKADRDAVLSVNIDGFADEPLEQTVGDIVAELASQFFYLRIEDNTQVVPTASASGPVAERVRELAEQKVAALMQQAEEARAAGNESKAKEYEEAAGIVREAGALVVRRLRTWERET